MAANSSPSPNPNPNPGPGFTHDSDELAAVQARLVEDFDLEEVRERLGVERCWTLYSQHVVKLRSIEIA